MRSYQYRDASLEGSTKGMGPVVATKGLFAREGCAVKIRTGGMPRIVKKREEKREVTSII